MGPQNKKSWVLVACAVLLMAGCGGGEGVGPLPLPDGAPVIEAGLSPSAPPEGAPVVVQVHPTQPIRVTLTEGRRLVMYATLKGSQPMDSLCWRFNDGRTCVMNGLQFAINGVRLEDTGRYRFEASNRYGFAASNYVYVTVVPPVTTPSPQ